MIHTSMLGVVAAVGMLAAQASATPVSGAAFTTTNTIADGTGFCKNGNEDVNCNIYLGKKYVWLNGGPDVADLGNGEYFFAVLEPGGQGGNDDPNDGTPKNLSDDFDVYTDRTFTLAGGVIGYAGPHDFDSNKIRLMPYADTSNPGGVYILAICSLADGYPVNPSNCKYDAFKVIEGTDSCASGDPACCTVDDPACACDGTTQFCDPGSRNVVSIVKSATGTYKQTWSWLITKDVTSPTLVKQIGGQVKVDYSVSVSHGSTATISDAQVTGALTASVSTVTPNGNIPGGTVQGATLTDALLDAQANCSVTNGSNVPVSDGQVFPYSCTIGGNGVPAADTETNTARVTWGIFSADAENTFTFTVTDIDECVAVTDSQITGTLASACVGDANPKTTTYSRYVSAPTWGCTDFPNTATFTTNDSGTTGTASKSVRVCGPVKSGGLTIGFWQNTNGQSIISGGAATSNVCNSGTWLRLLAPFLDLSATAKCSAVATYVYNVIKAANASGASMNAMLKAQMLATALDVYFSDPALGGNKINATSPIGGISVDLTQVCKNIAGGCTIYENTSGAFGGATSASVSALLSYAAGQSNSGGTTWYGNIKTTQELAKDTFDAINNQKAFAP